MRIFDQQYTFKSFSNTPYLYTLLSHHLTKIFMKKSHSPSTAVAKLIT